MKMRLQKLAAGAALLIAMTATGWADSMPVMTVEHDAPSVGRMMKYNIILPAGYESSETRYPVLYLLHGLTSNYTAWARMRVPTYAADHQMIVVMPDVGNSWYVNWAKNEDGQKNNWHDYVINDLIEHIDSTYRTIDRREARAINGLSMGGYGALMLGLRNPEMFCSIGTHSGAISFARGFVQRLESGGDPSRRFRRREPSTKPNPAIGIENFSSQADRYPKGAMFETADQARAFDPFELVLLVPPDKMPHIYIDCGTEDGLIRSAKAFMNLLMDNTIPFTYAQSAGGHRAPYWAREVGHSMAVQAHIIDRNLNSAD